MKSPRIFTAVAALLLCCAAGHSGLPGQAISIEAGSGRLVTLSAAAASVFATDPKVVEVRPASPTSLFLFGVAPGRTSVAAMTATGRPVAQLEVTVQPSGYAAAVAAARTAASMPGQTITATPNANGMTVEGDVAWPKQADQITNIAKSGLTEKETLENRLSVNQPVQVNLRVRIVEMSRSLTRDLGVNWQTLANIGGRYGTIGLSSALPLLNAATTSLNSGYSFNTPGRMLDVNALIDAMAQDQLVHVLAEPNLTAMSGETASFLVGGEFPIPVAQFGDTISIEFKQYGVSLAFVPTVLDAGRISLHVRPEVSQLTNQGAIQLQSGTNTIQIPALQVRRADTTVELGSGQSFAIAGLLQDSVTMVGNNTPFLGDVPILGALFRSDNFLHNQTELVIIVTPYLVQPVSNVAALTMPDAGWHPPNDIERILLLRQKARDPADVSATPPNVPGDAGFVVQ